MTDPTRTPPQGAADGQCDWLFQNATVVDGTGVRGWQGDIAVRGERIIAVGTVAEPLAGYTAEQSIDASGLVIAPGFIDVHTHDDRAVLVTPLMEAKVSQGVTTVITGNCGVSLAPMTAPPVPPLDLLGTAGDFFPDMSEYLTVLQQTPAVNVAAMVGHSTLRVSAMDTLDRPATSAEIEAMGKSLDAAMAAGCIGFSTGLAYPPAFHAPQAEVVALASRVARFGGIHTTHMRDERAGVVDSVRETIAIGREAGVPVVISHHKCSGRDNWGLTQDTLAEIDRAQRTAGALPIDLDVYPYTASSTVLLPDFVRSADRILITWSKSCPEMAGQEFAAITEQWGCSVDEAIERLQPAGAIYFQMGDDDLERVLRFPGAMIGSDGLPHDEVPHPRLWGTFPRVLGHYVRERGLLTLEDAVSRMTSKPADVFGLSDRGRIRPGAFADLVIFDAAQVLDTATYEDPIKASAGIGWVFVNGQPVWSGAGPSGLRPGQVLHRDRAD